MQRRQTRKKHKLHTREKLAATQTGNKLFFLERSEKTWQNVIIMIYWELRKVPESRR